ncbi:MAG: serine hydrolase [Candidatus Aminicenantales bacterium]
MKGSHCPELLAACWVAAFVIAAAALPARAQTALEACGVSDRADKWLAAYEADSDFSGVVLIAQGDRILAEKTYGKADFVRDVPNTIETRFRIASLTKTYTAACIELLVMRGRLGLRDTLGRYVSGIANGDVITVEQLLLHKSGIGVVDTPDRYIDCLPSAELLRRLRDAKPLFPPGKDDQYSNEGYFLLALIIEKVSGASYEQFLRDNIFSPLGMKSSGIACKDLPPGPDAAGHVPGIARNAVVGLPANEAAEIGSGSAYSNVRDLLSWLRAVDSNPSFKVDRWRYPYGWGKRNYSGRALIEQSGIVEGFNAHIALYPGEHIYAVVLGNIQSGLFNRVPKDLEKVLFSGETTRPPAVVPVELEVRKLQDYAGEYASDAIPYHQTLAVQDGTLYMRWGQFPFRRALIPTGNDEFFFRYEYATVRFGRDSSGKVVSMSWQWPEGSPMAFRKL